MKKFKSITELAKEISGHDIVHHMDNNKKIIESFLKRAFNEFDINLSDYTKGKKYKLNEEICDYIKKGIKSGTLPNYEDIHNAFIHPSEILDDLLKITKQFSEDNFDDETFKKVKSKIEKLKSEIFDSMLETIRNETKYAYGFRDFKFSFLSGIISYDDIDFFVEKVYHCYKEEPREPQKFITKRDLILLDYMRLPQLLKRYKRDLESRALVEFINNIKDN
ncbi:MAG: hypothetical protein II998_09560 [Clostridia bacterium]|nr:hypothetical protein [Clostridia bacterium]